MLLSALREELALYARKMYESQLVRATQGNLSARDPESGRICITPTGADYQSLRGEDIVVIDRNGSVVEGRWEPSSELPLHTLLLERRPDINCVMHTHSTYASAFAVVYQPIPMILQESAACLGGDVPVVSYQMSGTREFAELIADSIGDRHALLWGNHGAMVIGSNLAQTFAIAHALEDSARIATIARQLGEVVTLPPAEVARLHAMWLQSYRQKSLQ